MCVVLSIFTTCVSVKIIVIIVIFFTEIKKLLNFVCNHKMSEWSIQSSEKNNFNYPFSKKPSKVDHLIIRTIGTKLYSGKLRIL